MAFLWTVFTISYKSYFSPFLWYLWVLWPGFLKAGLRLPALESSGALVLKCRFLGSISDLHRTRISAKWTWESSFCILTLPRCFFCTLKFENHCLTFLRTQDCKQTIWCLYFPQYSHTSTQNLQYCTSYITVMSLEIGFRILFMTKKKIGWRGQLSYLAQHLRKICDYLCVLMSNIYLISLRDGLTGPLTKLRWFQDGLETPPEYILNFY